MKSTIGLFGKVIIVGLVATIIISVLVPKGGVLSLMPKANATYKTESSKELVADIANAGIPRRRK